jgi:hypothetical protein
MKLICKIDRDECREFDPFKLVIEIVPGNLHEVDVEYYKYGNEIQIKTAAGVVMNPRDLTISCGRLHAAQILLHVEICRFVLQQFPELSGFAWDAKQGKMVQEQSE